MSINLKVMMIAASLALGSSPALAQRGGGGGGGGGGGEGANGAAGDNGIFALLHADRAKAAAPAARPRPVARPRGRGGPASDRGCAYDAAWTGLVASSNCEQSE